MLISGVIAAAATLSNPGYVPAKLYRFRDGDTLARVAKLNETGYRRLMDANPDMDPEGIRPGTVIVIPARVRKGFEGASTFTVSAAAPAAAEASAGSTARLARMPSDSRAAIHAVRNGETDWSIARRYGIKPSDLRRMNPGVEWTSLQIGTELKVPGKAKPDAAEARPGRPAPAGRPGTTFATVQSGDNDWVIARRFDIKPSELRAMNPGTDWRSIRPGHKVRVPAGQGSSAQVAARAAASSTLIRTKRVAVAKDDVNIRAGGRTSARVVAQADRGEMATVVDRIGDWYKIRFGNGATGWARGDMLKGVSARDVVNPAPIARNERGTARPIPGVKRGDFIVVKRDDVNVRTGGKTSARVRTTVAQGTSARVLGYEGDWVKVRFATGLTGYLRSDMVKRGWSGSAGSRNVASNGNRPSQVARRGPGNSVGIERGEEQRQQLRRETARRTGTDSAQQSRSERSARRSSPSSIIDDSRPVQRVASNSAPPSGLLGTARTYLGTRYRWGGTSRSTGVDCSGFTSSVFKKNGVSIPRTSREQATVGKAVSKSSLQKGDLVFFRTRGSRISHVGIYVGNNKFIHASSGRGRVRTDSLDGYYARRYAGARRVGSGVNVGSLGAVSASASSSRSSSSSSSRSRRSSSNRASTSGRLPAVGERGSAPRPAARQSEDEDRRAMEQAERQLNSEPRPTRAQPGTDVSGR